MIGIRKDNPTKSNPPPGEHLFEPFVARGILLIVNAGGG
jgi:hypothetical protein